jgi:hypothetical protein
MDSILWIAVMFVYVPVVGVNIWKTLVAFKTSSSCYSLIAVTSSKSYSPWTPSARHVQLSQLLSCLSAVASISGVT